jgi:hypothetical protein
VLVIVLDGVLRRLTARPTTGGGFDEQGFPDVTVCGRLVAVAELRERERGGCGRERERERE